MGKKGTFKFIVEPFKCDFSGHIMLSNLGNYMLNAADFHAAERGFGYNDLMEQNKAWVLSRFVIELNEYPVMYDKLCISTWVESAMKFFTRRNWSIEDEKGKVFGYGSSVWAMIDIDSRQPTNILSVNDGCMANYVASEDTVPIDSPSRVGMDEKGAHLVGEVIVTYSDIDINGHTNSVRYIEHVLNLFPLEWHKAHTIRRIEVAYVAESYHGDKLRFYSDHQTDETVCIRICRVMPNDEEREVCRVKVNGF